MDMIIYTIVDRKHFLEIAQRKGNCSLFRAKRKLMTPGPTAIDRSFSGFEEIN